MSKKSSPMKQSTNMEQKLSVAEVDYRVGNFHEARKLAHTVKDSKDAVADNIKKAESILKKTSVDAAVWAVGLASLAFITVVALVSSYK